MLLAFSALHMCSFARVIAFAREYYVRGSQLDMGTFFAADFAKNKRHYHSRDDDRVPSGTLTRFVACVLISDAMFVWMRTSSLPPLCGFAEINYTSYNVDGNLLGNIYYGQKQTCCQSR